jgi:hypothetical protein
LQFLIVLISACNAAQEKEKKEKKVLLSAGVSNSAAHTVFHFQQF